MLVPETHFNCRLPASCQVGARLAGDDGREIALAGQPGSYKGHTRVSITERCVHHGSA